MASPKLGRIGGGQLGSLLSIAAKKLDIETVIISDDNDAPAKNFNKNFIYGNYEDEHPQSLVDDLQEKRKIISDFAKTMGDNTGMPENVQPEREQPEVDS